MFVMYATVVATSVMLVKVNTLIQSLGSFEDSWRQLFMVVEQHFNEIANCEVRTLYHDVAVNSNLVVLNDNINVNLIKATYMVGYGLCPQSLKQVTFYWDNWDSPCPKRDYDEFYQCVTYGSGFISFLEVIGFIVETVGAIVGSLGTTILFYVLLIPGLAVSAALAYTAYGFIRMFVKYCYEWFVIHYLYARVAGQVADVVDAAIDNDIAKSNYTIDDMRYGGVTKVFPRPKPNTVWPDKEKLTNEMVANAEIFNDLIQKQRNAVYYNKDALNPTVLKSRIMKDLQAENVHDDYQILLAEYIFAMANSANLTTKVVNCFAGGSSTWDGPPLGGWNRFNPFYLVNGLSVKHANLLRASPNIKQV